MLQVTARLFIPDTEIELHAMRSQGAGGQHVNKVASAVHLRFDIRASSLPHPYKERLLSLRDHRISEDGIVTIKAQQFRSQEQNREDALNRLRLMIQSVAVPPKKRKPTAPTHRSKQRRLESKAKRAKLKALRRTLE